MTMIAETEMPAPDTIVNTKDGPLAAMFFYAAAEQDLGAIAVKHGFDTRCLSMEDDAPEEMSERWFDGDMEAMKEWNPTPQDGWTLAAKFDNEDGPIAIFIRPSADLGRSVPHHGSGP